MVYTTNPQPIQQANGLARGPRLCSSEEPAAALPNSRVVLEPTVARSEQSEQKCLRVCLKYSHPLKYFNPLRLVLCGHSRGPKKTASQLGKCPSTPYLTPTGWNATTSTFQPVEGKRGGVDKIAERFRPTAAE